MGSLIKINVLVYVIIKNRDFYLKLFYGIYEFCVLICVMVVCFVFKYF